MNEKIVLVGSPNVGKSLLFNKLGSIYSLVANYPHTTVELIKTNLTICEKQFDLIDCPGINSLAAHSEDELVTRDVLIKENPAAIIQCLDATNIERSLLLTSQLAELGIPLILVLNILDESQKIGIWIDAEKLEHILGIPVVETIATENKGIQELLARLALLIEKPSVKYPDIRYKNIIEDGIASLQACFPESPPPRALLLLLLTMDKDIAAGVKEKYGDAFF